MTTVEEQSADLRWVSTYFYSGGYPTKERLPHPYVVKDPPVGGQASCFLIPGKKNTTIFYPYIMWSTQVPNGCAEVFKARDLELRPDSMVDIITRRWELSCRLGVPADYDVAALVLHRLGAAVPTVVRASSVETDGEQKERGGKPIDESKRRYVAPGSRRGGVLKFFMPDGAPASRSIREAMAELDLTRSGVLSHLFALNRDHGIGYQLAADCATVLVPEGWDPFAAPEPAVAPKAPTDGSAPRNSEPTERAPRGSRGKATDPTRLVPIPEGSKRAAVALHFAAGLSSLVECEAATGIGARSIHSHLHDIHSYHGLGHVVEGDRYRLDVPEGFKVTGPKPERKRKP